MQTEWLKQEKCVFCKIWGLEVQYQDANSVSAGEDSLPDLEMAPSVCVTQPCREKESTGELWGLFFL